MSKKHSPEVKKAFILVRDKGMNITDACKKAKVEARSTLYRYQPFIDWRKANDKQASN